MQTYDENSPYFYTRSDVSDDVKKRVLREQLLKAIDSVKAGRVHSAEEVKASFDQFRDDFHAKNIKNAS